MISCQKNIQRKRWGQLLKILAVLVFVVGAVGCLEVEERPVLDPKDLIKIKGAEGIFHMGLKKSGEKAVFLQVHSLPEKQYRINLIEIYENGKVKVSVSFDGVFSPLIITHQITKNF